MPEPREGEHQTRTLDGRELDLYPLTWEDGGVSWEVRDVETDKLLTMAGSYDAIPDDTELGVLLEAVLAPRCGTFDRSWSGNRCENLVVWNLAVKVEGRWCRAQSMCDKHLAVIATEFYEGADTDKYDAEEFAQLRPFRANLPEID